MVERPDLAHPAGREWIVAQQANSGIACGRLLNERRGTVGTAAVHDENLTNDRTLRHQSVQAGGQSMLLVERRDDDAHRGWGRRVSVRLDRRAAMPAREESDREQRERSGLRQREK